MPRFAFDVYSLDTDRRELTRAGEAVRLEPQVFDLLEYLVANRARLVSRDDLIAGVWNGRIVSESALATRINAARAAIGDGGGAQRLIKTIPRKGLRFVGEVREEAAPAPGAPAWAASGVRPRPERPSVAVLPFANLSGDPAQDYFVDGITVDLTTALSRMRWLFVIANSSAFTFKGRALDVRQVASELGVRYVLEGTVRRAGERVRITAQLIDGADGTTLSAERIEGTLEDIFDLQDRVTRGVVGAIAPTLEKAEIARALRKPTENLDAYDHYLRGLASMYCFTQESFGDALDLFRRATQLDPGFAAAHGLAARCHAWRLTNGWMDDPVREIPEATMFAARAAELGIDDAVALSAAGLAIARIGGDMQAGAGLIDRALSLNPNLATAWLYGGYVRLWSGDSEAAIEMFQMAARLSPVDPQFFNLATGIAAAHFLAGRLEEASRWADKALSSQPRFGPAIRVAIASHALAGRIGDAQKAVALLRALNPRMRMSSVRDLEPYRRPQDLARFSEGFRMAGLSE